MAALVIRTALYSHLRCPSRYDFGALRGRPTDQALQRIEPIVRLALPAGVRDFLLVCLLAQWVIISWGVRASN